MTNLERIVNRKLNEFLAERKERFHHVTAAQHKKWLKNVTGEITARLDDNEIFYDWKPDDVIEHNTCE